MPGASLVPGLDTIIIVATIGYGKNFLDREEGLAYNRAVVTWCQFSATPNRIAPWQKHIHRI